MLFRSGHSDSVFVGTNSLNEYVSIRNYFGVSLRIRKGPTIGRWGFLLFAWAILGILVRGDEGDLQLWNELMLTEYQTNQWRTYTWAETRHGEDASRLGLWMVQQKVYYRIAPDWEVGLGGSHLDVKDFEGDWNHQTRLELELNPRWELGDESVLLLRNRLEFRRFDREKERHGLVTRHRILYAKRANWFGRMNRFEVSNEFFFDTQKGTLSENRFRPLNLFFDTGSHSTVNLFSQIRSKRASSEGDWSHTIVFGFGLRLRR